MELAARMRELREQAGLTRTALARPRYTVSYVSQIESGRRKPSAQALEFFAGKLGVSAGYLATGIPEGLEQSLRYQLEDARRLLREGQPDQARSTVQPVLAQADQYAMARLYAEALVVDGDALAHLGKLREAIDAYEEALEGGLPEREEGMAVSSVAKAYRSLGDLTYAAEAIEAYLGRRDRPPLDPGVSAELQTTLVSIYFERGDVLRAERAARRALAAADDGAPLRVRASVYWNASRVLAEARRWDEALDYATRARILMEQVEDRRMVARLHNAYAYICLEAEPPRTDEAGHHLVRAEELLGEVGGPDDLAYVFTERGRLALLEGRPEEGLAYAERALDSVGDPLERARCLYLKGRALGLLNRHDEARDRLREAAGIFREQGSRQQEAGCWREIGELEVAAGRTEGALEALRAGLAALDPRRSRA